MSPELPLAVKPLLRLKQRKEFLRAAKQGRKWAMPGLVLQVLQRKPHTDRNDVEADAARVGFTVTKKVGNAVIRNRVRRRLRAVANDVLPTADVGGFDLVIIGRMGSIKRPYLKLVKDLQTALRKVKAGQRPQGKEKNAL